MGIGDRIALFEQAYSFVVERFEYFLDSLNCYGSIIMDEANKSKEVSNLRIAHRKILNDGVIVYHLYGGEHLPSRFKSNSMHKYATDKSDFVRMQVKRIVENLQYQQDQDNNFIQVADLVAYALSLKYNCKKDRFYTKYKKFLRKSPRGRIEGYGLKIFP